MSLWFVIPQREIDINLSWSSITGMFALVMITGLLAGLIIGASAAFRVPLGENLAAIISPFWSNVMVSIYLAPVCI